MYDARHLLLGLLLKEKSLISYLQIVKLGFGRLQCFTLLPISILYLYSNFKYFYFIFCFSEYVIVLFLLFIVE